MAEPSREPVNLTLGHIHKNLAIYTLTLIGQVGGGSPYDWACVYKVHRLPDLTLFPPILPNKRQSIQD